MVSPTQSARICVSFYYLKVQFPSVPLAALFPSAKLTGSCVLTTGFLWLLKQQLVDWQLVGVGAVVFGAHLLLLRGEVEKAWKEVLKAKTS